MTINIDALISDVLLKAQSLATELALDSEKAKSILNQFLQDNKDNLTTWANELANGQITADDFADLVDGEIPDAILHEYEQIGLKDIQHDKLINGLIQILTLAVGDAVKMGSAITGL